MRTKISVIKTGHFSGHTNSIFTLILSIKPDHIYTAGADGYIVEWDLLNKGDGVVICRLPKPVYSLLLLPETQQLLAGTSSGNLHVIDLSQNKEIKNIELHQLGIFDMKLLGASVITVGGDGFLSRVDCKTFALINKIKTSTKSARVIAINPNGLDFAVGFSDHLIRIYDVVSFDLKQVLTGHTNSVFALCYSPDSQYLLSGGRDVQLKRWAVNEPYQLVNDVAAHTLHINTIAFNTDGTLFITGSMDKSIKIWDSHTFELLKVVDKLRKDSHLNSVNKLLWVKNAQFASISDDKMMMLWELIS
ncbi:MAG: WD40 repeat domain-containing protein [Bacteroidota bacterium]|nr:WD40 repeat domain-containing protein [Bacteroidota bacterium]